MFARLRRSDVTGVHWNWDGAVAAAASSPEVGFAALLDILFERGSVDAKRF